jgi:hypothetical protein
MICRLSKRRQEFDGSGQIVEVIQSQVRAFFEKRHNCLDL